MESIKVIISLKSVGIKFHLFMDYFEQEDEPDYFDFNPTYRIYQPMHNSEDIMYLQMDSIVCQKQVQTNIQYTTKSSQQKREQSSRVKAQLNRSRMIIQVNDIKHQNYQKMRKGGRKQTSNFGKFIRAQFMKEFKKIVLMQKMDQNQMLELKAFFFTAGSLKSIKKLFKSEILRQMCSKIYNSRQFIANILKQSNMQFSNKLSVLKYFKNMQNFKEDDAKSWRTANFS